MELLEGPVRAYQWGSPTAIPVLLGRPVTGDPAAELWLGAHPSGPARVGAAATPLNEVVAADPIGALGPDAADRFESLPFLLKVLAAASPLSLQAHPSASQAQAGFARESAAGIPLDAPDRSFRDRSHKPELICAVSRFQALCGFRAPASTLEVLASVDAVELDPVRSMLRHDPSPVGLHDLLERLLTMEPIDAGRLTAAVAEACHAAAAGPFEAERAVALALAQHCPGDPGVVISLLMNLVTLEPDEALFLGAGNLHCYLSGTGIEVLANSDNVVRGGLTPKHVDVPTLLEIVDTTPGEPAVQRPGVVAGVATYECPVRDFSLQRLEVDGSQPVDEGPAILFCLQGAARIGTQVLERGSAVWLPAVDGPLALEGVATVFRAGLGQVG